MREIEKAVGADVNSNLSPLIDAFKASPFKVAPEREAEMMKIHDDLGLRIRMDGNQKDWIFEGLSLFGTNRISVSLRSLERLWGVCYAYTAIVSEIQETQGNYSKLAHSVEYQLAFDMLDWVAQDTLAHIEGEWPKNLPSPRQKNSLKHVEAANHYFLMTAGRILLHEIAHLVLEHSTDPNTTPEKLIAEEFEADDWADNWMFERWRSHKNDPLVFVGRSMGVAFCHAITLFFGAGRPEASLTHPNPIDRLVRFVERYMPEGIPTEKRIEHSSCGMLLAVIGAQLHKKGHAPDYGSLADPYPVVFKRFREYFN